MREIKFRFWDNKEKKMYDDWGYGYMENLEDYGVNEVFENLCGETYIPMQYTGLKDKNGKEIYEGDIVLISGIKYEIDWSEMFARFYPYPENSRDEIDDFDITNEACENWKIIGNRWENPELLK